MRNLKRVLSLGLASTMLVGMMATSASAASMFTDADTIVNENAVNTLVALNIIDGKDDGSFDPEGIVTRAEMTKMIAYALNKGKAPTLTKTCSYPDAANHWAAGYIQYCSNLKIVDGDTDGNFNPDKTVTGIEAAKMILIALGYNSEDEGYVNNANWDTNISIDANTKDLYNDLSIDPSLGLTRDDAALMIMNGLDATKVVYDYKLTTVNGELVSLPVTNDTYETLLWAKFGLSTDYGVMIDAEYNSEKEEYSYTFTGAMDEVDTDRIAGTVKHDDDFSDLYGMKVKVLRDEDNTVYGMFATDTTVMASGLMSDINWDDVADGYVTIDDVKYDVEEGTTEATMPAWSIFSTRTGAVADFAGTDSFTLIDNDDNGDANLLVVTPYVAGTVTYVNADKINVKAATGGTVAYKYEDHTIVEGLAKDDVVTVVAAANSVDGKAVVAAIDMFEGEVTAINKGNNKFTIDGTVYTAFTGLTFEVGETYELHTVGTYIWYAEQTSESTTMADLVYISAFEAAGNISGAAAKAYFMDGTNAVIEVTKISDVDGKEFEDTDYLENLDDDDGGKLFTFSEKDGEYELTLVGKDSEDVHNMAGFDSHKEEATGYVKATKTMGGAEFADDAVIVAANEDDVEFITGKDVLDWKDDFGTSFQYLADEVDGFDTIQVAVIKHADDKLPGATGDDAYGYVTSDPTKVKVGDDMYWSYTVWTADGAMDVMDEYVAGASYDVEAGVVIGFADLGDGYIELCKTGEAFNIYGEGNVVALKGYTSSKVSLVSELELVPTIDLDKDDTTYLYVDTEEQVGMESGAFAVADKLDSGLYYCNVLIVSSEVDGVDVADLVVIDVNNVWFSAAGDEVVTGTLNEYNVTGDDVTATTFEYGDETVDVTVTIDAPAAASIVTVTTNEGETASADAAIGNTSVVVTVPVAGIGDVTITDIAVAAAPVVDPV